MDIKEPISPQQEYPESVSWERFDAGSAVDFPAMTNEELDFLNEGETPRDAVFEMNTPVEDPSFEEFLKSSAWESNPSQLEVQSGQMQTLFMEMDIYPVPDFERADNLSEAENLSEADNLPLVKDPSRDFVMDSESSFENPTFENPTSSKVDPLLESEPTTKSTFKGKPNTGKKYSNTDSKAGYGDPSFPVESRYKRRFNAEYDYQPKDDCLFTEKVPQIVKTPSDNDIPKPIPTQKSKREGKESLFLQRPVEEFHLVLNSEDFYDVDEYLALADRPPIINPEYGWKGSRLPKHSGYYSPKEPVIFVGKLTGFGNYDRNGNRARICCFTALDLNKYQLFAFPRKDSSVYTPSYSVFDVTKAQIGTYWHCKVIPAVESGELTWAEIEELKAPSLRDIFQNPDPKFRPKGWCILNDKFIFSPSLIQGKPSVQLEGFQVKSEENKTKMFYGSVEGMFLDK